MKHGAHEGSEDDEPGAGRDPEGRASGHVQVVQRVAGAPLPHHEGDQGGQCDGCHAQHEGPGSRHGREVDAQDEAAHQEHGQDPADVVDRGGRLVDVRGPVGTGRSPTAPLAGDDAARPD
jgi:hypothetical protein